VIYKESLSWKQGFGFFLVITGLIFFYSQQIQFFSKDLLYNKGVLWVIFGAVSWTVYAVLQKRLVQSYPAQQLNLIIYGLPALLYIPLTDFGVFPEITRVDWALLIFGGINTLIAYGSLALAFKYLEANKISVIITLNPIITFIIMAILGHQNVSWIEPEHMNIPSVIGAILVITGAVFVVFFRKKRQR
jgi:drug/metabolite transporter (DMT)-like permease